MTPRFILPLGYDERDMMLVLARGRHGKGWEFRGYADGYSVNARNHRHELLCNGSVFDTKQDAAIMARALNLPEYATWNGRKRCYVGKGAIIRAYPRTPAQTEIVGAPIRKEFQ